MPVITINSVTWGTQMIGKKTFNGFLDVVARLRYVYTYWWCELLDGSMTPVLLGGLLAGVPGG